MTEIKKNLLDTNLTLDEVINLINAGADVNQVHPENKKAPLHVHQNIDILKILIKHNADVNQVDKTNRTPLCYVDPGNKEKVKLLIKHGANIERDNFNSYKVLYSNNNNPSIFKLLVKSGADIHAKDGGERNILRDMYNIKIIDFCLKHGVDINNKDLDEKTPLHLLVSENEEHLDVIEYLLDKGANINALGRSQKSVLNYAVSSNKKSVVSLLLRKNADPNIFQKTPLDYAKNKTIKKMLIKHGAVPSTITWFQENRDLFSKEQQTAFDTYASLTSKDSDFFQMCKDYQEKIQSTINVQVNDVGNNLGY
jgi:ankyrin repeat protein